MKNSKRMFDSSNLENQIEFRSSKFPLINWYLKAVFSQEFLPKEPLSFI